MIHEYYVATTGNDSWTGTLPEPNSTRTDGPFRTLHRARGAMQETAVKRCFVRGGTHVLPDTLRLDSHDAGTSYIAYPGETPVVVGSRAVPQQHILPWDDHRFSVDPYYLADLDVFCNGRRLDPASYPARDPNDYTAGWLWAKADAPDTSTIIGADGVLNDLLKTLNPTTRVWVQAFDKERLSDGLVPLATIDGYGSRVRTTHPMQYKVRSGGTFRFYGSAEWIKGPGEFGFIGPTNQLIVWPRDPTNIFLTIPHLDILVDLQGTSNITFWGLTFRENKREAPAIRVQDSDHVIIQGCRFAQVGEAIRFSNSLNCDALGCVIDDVVANGCYQDQNSRGNRVQGCTVRNVGTHCVARKNGTGIGGNGVHASSIRWNDVTNCARYGISLKDWNANNSCSDNLVQFNRITNTLLEGADGGAIETLGRSNNQTRSRILDNYIDGVYGIASYWDTESAGGKWLTRYKGFGIYLDDKTNAVEVNGNFIQGVPSASVFVHGGDNNTVANNVAILSGGEQRFLRVEWLGPQGGETGKPSNTVVRRNIVLNLHPGTPIEPYWTFFTPGSVVIQQNLVWGTKTYWPDGTDVAADPGFQNLPAGDYRLAPNSPAPSMGINGLLWSFMGTVGYVPDPVEPPKPLYTPMIPVLGTAQQLFDRTFQAASGTHWEPPPPPPEPVVGYVSSISIPVTQSAVGTHTPPPAPPAPPVLKEPWYRRWYRWFTRWF